MQTIFVMLKCEPGAAYEVAAEAIDTIEEVAEVHSISGQYDLLVKFHLPDDVDIGRFVTGRVQTLRRVRDSFTIMAFNAFT
jgi:DNA-binding Lrp family transcriptional regulator